MTRSNQMKFRLTPMHVQFFFFFFLGGGGGGVIRFQYSELQNKGHISNDIKANRTA